MELTGNQQRKWAVATLESIENRKSYEPFGKFGELTTREAYDYYRKNRRYISKTVDQYNYFVKAVNGLFETLSAMIVESEGGVYIEGFGYFCVIKRKNKRQRRAKSLLLRKVRIDSYYPYFFPEGVFQEWTMDRTFHANFRDNIWAQKNKWKIHFDLCHAITEASRYIKQRDKQRINFKNKTHDFI